ncbi:hypothetical protein P3552_23855, partial [Vibrio parahaemolyticus]|nr:hypothetical protein [Vibrio parahaemolyticus]
LDASSSRHTMTQGGGKFIFRYRSVITGELANCVPIFRGTPRTAFLFFAVFCAVQRLSNQNPTTIQPKSAQHHANNVESNGYPTEKQPKSMIEHVGCC